MHLATADLYIIYYEMLHPKIESALISFSDNGTTSLEEVRKNAIFPFLLYLVGKTHFLQLYVIIYREGISFIGQNSEITGLAVAGSSTLLSISADGKLSSWNLQTKIR